MLTSGPRRGLPGEVEEHLQAQLGVAGLREVPRHQGRVPRGLPGRGQPVALDAPPGRHGVERPPLARGEEAGAARGARDRAARAGRARDGPDSFTLNHRCYWHLDQQNNLWLSAEDGCEGVLATSPQRRQPFFGLF